MIWSRNNCRPRCPVDPRWCYTNFGWLQDQLKTKSKDDSRKSPRGNAVIGRHVSIMIGRVSAHA